MFAKCLMQYITKMLYFYDLMMKKRLKNCICQKNDLSLLPKTNKSSI